MTTQAGADAVELVLTERDDKQAIYESWVRLSTEQHGFHRYCLVTGSCQRIDKARPTSCDLSVAIRVGEVIRRAIDEADGEVPPRISRAYW